MCKTYGGVEVDLHEFLKSVLRGGRIIPGETGEVLILN
jgi:hypothetical protein